MSTSCSEKNRLRGEVQREVLIRDPATLFVQIYCLMVALAMGLGAVILFGGPERFASPTFSGPRDLIEWSGVNAQITWGLVFVALGVGLIVAMRRRAAVTVLRFGLVIYAFLTVTFLKSAFDQPTAVLTGVVAYSIFATAHLLLSSHLQRYGWR